jgi:hypothetical protein
MEITVEGDPRNVVHQNLILIQASSLEEAYEKALGFGRNGETNYSNPAGKIVAFKFRGLSHLSELYEDIEDGAEITFQSKVEVSEQELISMVKTRERLCTPVQFKRPEGPDFSSGEVIAMLEQQFGIKLPDDGASNEA